MAAWILGGCGANYGAPAFYQCQPTDPYANVEIPDLLTSITVPRIKFVVCPDERKRRNRLFGQYGDEFIVDDARSTASGPARRGEGSGVFHDKSKGSQDYIIKVRGDGFYGDGVDSDGEPELGPDGMPRHNYNNQSHFKQNSGDAQYDRHGNLLPPPISPISEADVRSRSSDRIKSLQALLGGSALTDRYGKPPPISAPYYQSGALHEADADLEPIAVSTPEMHREATWIR